MYKAVVIESKWTRVQDFISLPSPFSGKSKTSEEKHHCNIAPKKRLKGNILTCVSLGMTRCANINSTTEEQQEGQES